MSRVQLALAVPDLDEAVDFYSALFATSPHKRREGYANFAVEQPPLKLVLFEVPDEPTRLDHLGVEVASPTVVAAAADRLADSGLETDVRHHEVCCHAEQDKVWVTDPGGARWEVYTVTDDTPAETRRGADAHVPA
jgi:catechol 2,3-dioxygenase-like lactoylglutathione lyase family enzyme